MRSALFLLAWLGATPSSSPVVVVTERETLAQIAERTLGDARGASELKALNKLTEDAVPAGTALKLPPEAERARALSALATARNAVAQADRQAAKRQEAAAKLQEAETHFRSADYASAARAADNAWSLLSSSGSQPSSFQVSVDDSGATTVAVHSGPPVHVVAEQVTQPVKPGETIRVEKGQPPPAPIPPLAAPRLQSPTAGFRHKAEAVKGRIGPVLLKWAAVEGAKEYEVEVLRPDGTALRQKVSTPQWQLPPQPAGSYRWTVRAFAEGRTSDASAERLLELVEDQVKLQVGNPTWNP